MSESPEDPKAAAAAEGSSGASGMGDEGAGAPSQTGPGPGVSDETASLLGLVDRLGAMLERSDLVELEVEAGETGIILRKPAALAPAQAAPAVVPGPAEAAPAPPAAPEAPAPSPSVRAVRAPLTGVFYASPSPTAPPFVTVGQIIDVGHVIGLIEAMKLFNEIKSDQGGRVARVVAESGKLVKAKQTLIEVEPA
jgi:acetyl-CoA carboxylase biotin carboxyl carrier protein